MSACTSADIFPLVSRNAATEAFRNALRLYVGRGRRYSVKQLETGSGVPARMIESYVAPVHSTEFRLPPIEAILSLSKFLGAEFTTEWLVLAGQGAFDIPDGDDDVDELAEEADGLSAEVRRARSPKSPGGQNIVPIERESIKRRGRRVCSMARAVA